MRLQRALARAGVASRRNAEHLIRAGRVRVNGVRATIGQTVDTAADEIIVSGRRLRFSTRTVWIALHKPTGYVVTKGDPGKRPTVFTLVPSYPGLSYVGRLDIMSSGLLLLTNDGQTANRLLHPRYAVERTYRVRVRGLSVSQIRRALSSAIVIDGRAVGLARFNAKRVNDSAAELTLVLTEGRHRIVRRVCGQLGLTVVSLKRVSHGPIRLGRLAVGKWRNLTDRELQALARLRVA